MTGALAAGPIQVRIGLHTGTPLLDRGGLHRRRRPLRSASRLLRPRRPGHPLAQRPRELVELELTDLGEHRLKDIAEAVPIFQLGNGSFPPLKTISNTNLPRPASSFVGRDDELLEVLLAVRGRRSPRHADGPRRHGQDATRHRGSGDARARVQGRRLLGGPGHASRSRARHGDDRPDAGRQGRPGRAHRRAGDAAAARQPRAGDRLRHPSSRSSSRVCPNLTLLVTEPRAPAHPGEVEYAVPPLAEPEAVDLFCERAQLEPSETIAELCGRLDYLPLAVELAAARTSALTPEQILERLSQRLDLLKGGRDADPRQQTLRATIEWSLRSALSRRSSSSSRGCPSSPAAARWRQPRRSAMPISTRCSRSSRRASLRFTDGRYWMLETIREYAAERARVGCETERDSRWRTRRPECSRLAEPQRAGRSVQGSSRAVRRGARQHPMQPSRWADASSIADAAVRSHRAELALLVVPGRTVEGCDGRSSALSRSMSDSPSSARCSPRARCSPCRAGDSTSRRDAVRGEPRARSGAEGPRRGTALASHLLGIAASESRRLSRRHGASTKRRALVAADAGDTAIAGSRGEQPRLLSPRRRRLRERRVAARGGC